MMSYPRGSRPDFLAEYKSWGKAWNGRRQEAVSSDQRMPTFHWHTVEGEELGKRIRQDLCTISGGRCAYCDGMLEETSPPTIDHFRPKSAYPRLAYVWHNLFPACGVCQAAKKEMFARHYLKPDRDGYCFEVWFSINFKEGKLEPNPRLSAEKQAIVGATIDWLDLNRPARCKSRLFHLAMANSQDFDPLDCPYRYLFR